MPDGYYRCGVTGLTGRRSGSRRAATYDAPRTDPSSGRRIEVDGSRPGPDRSVAASAGLFLAVAATALAYLVALSRRVWFTGDEWDFVAHRTIGSLDDLFRPQNEHWSTLPILVYRVLWTLFGLRTHLPHQVIAVVTHLAVAAL